MCMCVLEIKSYSSIPNHIRAPIRGSQQNPALTLRILMCSTSGGVFGVVS